LPLPVSIWTHIKQEPLFIGITDRFPTTLYHLYILSNSFHCGLSRLHAKQPGE